jgi:hypothetical protein
MTGRDEILAVPPAVSARTADGTFTPQDVINELHRRGTRHWRGRTSTFGGALRPQSTSVILTS